LNASCSWPTTPSFNAFIASGRLIVSVAMPLSSERRISSNLNGRPAAAWSETLTAMKNALEGLGGADPEGSLAPFSGEIHKDKQIFFTGGEENKARPFSVPMTFRKGKERGGVEMVRFYDNEEGLAASTNTRLFRITDLGLTYKVSSQNLLVWATSLRKGTPVKKVRLLALTDALEAFPLGATGKDGVFIYEEQDLTGVRLSIDQAPESVTRPLKIGEITYLAAVTEEDSGFIRVTTEDSLKPAAVHQSEGIEETIRVLKGYVFTERGVYRPGETVHFKGLVREYLDGSITAPAEVSCQLEIFNSKSEIVFTSEQMVSEYGSVSGEMVVKPFYPLGTYTLNMRFGEGESEVASRTFMVQEFRRPRHFTEIDFDRVTRRDDSYVNIEREADFLKIGIEGAYYSGGPVKHGQVRWKVYRAGTEHTAEGYGEYHFGYPAEKARDLLESGESILDESGRLEVEFPLDGDTLSGRYGLEVVATVLDFDGRAASGSKRYQVSPDYLVGIGPHPEKMNEGEEHSLNVIVLNEKGKPVRGGVVAVDVMQLSGTYVRKRNERGDLYWEYQDTWKKMLSGDVKLERGRGSFRFDFGWGGRYLVVFTYRDKEGLEHSSGTFIDVEWEYYWWVYENEEAPFESLGLFSEKKVYSPGEKARIHLSPRRRAVRYLMTVERRGVLDYRVLEVDPTDPTVEMAIGEEHAPNVYVSLLGTVPRSNFPVYGGQYDDEAPTFLFGSLNLGVFREKRTLEVGISEEVAKMKSRPGEKVTLTVTARDDKGRPVDAEVALGVVDESVLALSGYPTPSLDSLSRFDIPLGVFTGDLRAFLLKQTPFDLVRVEPLTGGGGMGVDAEALTSRARKRFDPVAFFDPDLRTGPEGQVEVTFTLPDTMTTYRVYAVACDKKAGYDTHQRPLLSVKEFYLEPGLPRFLTRGDLFSFDVSAFNVTPESGAMGFALKTEGGLELETGQINYPIGAHDSFKVPVTGEATGPGEAKAIFGAEFGDLHDAVEITLPVNSGYTLGRETLFGSFQGLKDVSMDLSRELASTDWEEIGLDETACLVTISGSPFLRMSSGLKYLLRYPYGCVEQTSSGVMPLAALRGLIKEGAIPDITLQETDKFLTKGIGRLLSMQTQSGGFGYWPGHDRPSEWGTVYAAAALTVAAASGIDVPEPQMKRAMDYMRREIKRAQNPRSLQPFMAYVLSMNGALDAATYQAAGKGQKDLSRESKILLLLAAGRAGLEAEDKITREAGKILETRWTENRSDEFRARYREPALSLLLAGAALPGDPLSDRLADQLMGGVNNRGIWTSTSDTGWSLFALHEYFKGAQFSEDTIKVSVDQANGQLQTIDLPARGFQTLALDPGAFLRTPRLTLTAEGDTTILYRVELAFPRVDYAEKGHSNGFKVWKEIQNMDGGEIIRVGDIVEVKVFIRREGDHYYRYVVLDDPLPAGLVAVNSALKTEESPAGGRSADEERYWYRTEDGYYRFVPGFFEIRDDRVLAFRDYLWGDTYQYSYYARAVSAGEFVLPSTKVQLMYQPEVSGYTPRSKVSIQRRSP
jgi:uncharacterized protein YfaS (alpha-2-macroglobulin family)